MPELHIRRVKMDDSPLRGDRMWVLFESGDIAHPIRMLTDGELSRLADEIERQKDDD